MVVMGETIVNDDFNILNLSNRDSAVSPMIDPRTESRGSEEASCKRGNELIFRSIWVWSCSTDAQGYNTMALTKEMRVIYLGLKEYNHVGGNLIIKVFF